MQEMLKEKLWVYIAHNQPDLLLKLQQENDVTRYLEEKVSGIEPLLSRLLEEKRPGYLIEELCLEELITGFEPSKFSYIRGILEEEFEPDYLRMKQTGLLAYEIVNLMNESETAFETLGFNADKEQDRKLRYAITGTIQEYLDCK